MNTADLQRQLEERDYLVQLLTAQLEQAAEQLDRLHRSGGVSARQPIAYSGVVGATGELAKQTEQIGQDVAYLVSQWDSSQLAGSIGRVEIQLEELRDMIQQVSRPAPAPTTYGALQAENWAAQAPVAHPPAAAPDPAAVEPPAPRPRSDEDRESMLFASLHEALNSHSTLSSRSPGTSHREDHGKELDLSGEVPLSAQYHLPELPELPELIEFESANTEQLQEAIIERDTYIRVIVEQFRKLHRSTLIQRPTDWEQLQQVPKALISRIEQLERQLEDQQRLYEVSMSIERARLSREATQLDLARIQLNKQLKKHGFELNTAYQQVSNMLPDEPKRTEQKSDSKENPRADKWLNMLKNRDK